MMDFNDFVNAMQKLEPSDFLSIEHEVGASLPVEVKAHYSAFNGGEPEKYIFVHDGINYVVQEFFPIKYGAAGRTMEDNYRDLNRTRKIIPQSFIPFALDPAGDYYCFDVVTGEIFLFRGEHLPNIDGCIKTLAKSMTEFVDGLTQDHE